MLCIRCGTENSEGSKYCTNCNALIPVAAPTGNPAQSTLDISESVDYELPDTHYQSPILQQLAWAVHELAEEDGELEPVVEAYEAYREIFENFKTEVPKLQEICYSQQGAFDDDPIPSQIKYMISSAETLYSDGEALFEGFFDHLEGLDEDAEFPDPTPLIDGTKKWLNCNDSVCTAFDFLSGRTKVFEELLVEMDDYILNNNSPEDLAAAEAATSETPTDQIDIG